MINADWIKKKMKIPLNDFELQRLATMNWNCEKCSAKELCEKEYPEGVSDSECTKIAIKWLKMEKSPAVNVADKKRISESRREK